MPAPRLRRCSTKRELEIQVDDYITQGYEILNQGEATALLRKRTWGSASGHVICFVLTFWWTLGMGNAIYALVAHANADKVMLKLGDYEEIEDDRQAAKD